LFPPPLASAAPEPNVAMPIRLFATCLSLLLPVQAILALDYVTRELDGNTKELAGKIHVEAEDGGVLLLTPDGAMWPLPKEQITKRRTDPRPFEPLTKPQLITRLTSELPAGFKFHQTKHYVIAYNTSPAYAQWVGSLYERLYAAFHNYWERRGMKLHEPEFPLVALVFDSRDSYAEFARAEVGEAARAMIGYYSLQSNRMIMYDLTGVEDLKATGDRSSAARINQILSQPGAERTVATIVHEATHQLAFNSGLQVRYADLPLWVSEGLAIFFETPDLGSAKGWRTIGGVNRVNLTNFRKYLRTRPADGLVTLLADDKRFREAGTGADAYAESWALTYFLLQTRKDAYVKYLQAMAEQAPLVDVPADERIARFKQHFGDDLAGLDAEFLRYMRSVE
jgi:hypothetical protein